MCCHLVLVKITMTSDQLFEQHSGLSALVVADFTKVSVNHERNRNKRNLSRWLPTTQKRIRTGFAMQRNNAFRFVVILRKRLRSGFSTAN